MLEDDFIKEFEDLFAEDQAASDPSEQQAAPPPPAPAAAAVQAAASAASSSSAALLEDLDLFVKEQAAAPAGLPASPAPPPVAAAASAVEAAAAAGSSSGAVSEQATQLAEASKQAGREKRRPSSPEKGQTGQTGKQQQTTPVRRCRLCHAQAGNRKCKQCLLPVCCACSPTMQTLRILVPGSDDTFRQSKGYVCRPCAESLAASPSCLSPLLPPSADVSPAKADPPSPSTSASSGAASSSSSAASSPLKQEGAGSPPSRTGAVLSHSRSSSSVASSSSSPRRRKRRPAPASAGHERKLDLSMSAPQLCVLQDGGCTRNGGEEDGGASRLLDCLITGDHAALLAQLQTERDEPLCRHLPTVCALLAGTPFWFELWRQDCVQTLMKRASRSDLVSQTLLWMSRAGTALPCMALSQPLLEDQSNAASPNLASPRASLPAGSEAPSHSPLLWEPFLRPERDQSIVFFAQLNDKEVVKEGFRLSAAGTGGAKNTIVYPFGLPGLPASVRGVTVTKMYTSKARPLLLTVECGQEENGPDENSKSNNHNSNHDKNSSNHNSNYSHNRNHNNNNSSSSSSEGAARSQHSPPSQATPSSGSAQQRQLEEKTPLDRRRLHLHTAKSTADFLSEVWGVLEDVQGDGMQHSAPPATPPPAPSTPQQSNPASSIHELWTLLEDIEHKAQEEPTRPAEARAHAAGSKEAEEAHEAENAQPEAAAAGAARPQQRNVKLGQHTAGGLGKEDRKQGSGGGAVRTNGETEHRTGGGDAAEGRDKDAAAGSKEQDRDKQAAEGKQQGADRLHKRRSEARNTGGAAEQTRTTSHSARRTDATGTALPASYQVIYKSGDDLRQDAAVLHCFALMNRMWHKAQLNYQHAPVRSKVYGVAPIDSQSGLIEYVPGCRSVLHIRQWRDRAAHDTSFLPRLVASSAGAYMACFFLGIGDRHYENILVAPDGQLFHVDFGYALGHRVELLDTAPIAIIPAFVEFLGTDHWNAFVELCVRAYSVLRQHSAVLQHFVMALFGPFLDLAAMRTHLRSTALLDKPQAEMEEKLRRMILNAPRNYKTRLKNFSHQVAQSMRNQGHSRKKSLPAALSMSAITLKSPLVSASSLSLSSTNSALSASASASLFDQSSPTSSNLNSPLYRAIALEHEPMAWTPTLAQPPQTLSMQLPVSNSRHAIN